MPRKRLLVTCPQCKRERAVLPGNWAKQLSELCQVCSRKVGTHGASDTRLYNTWGDMRKRCGVIRGGAKHNAHRYRGRGITVCPEWARSFEAFQAWALANGYRNDLVLDRRDNDLGYSPSNCRWVTWAESSRHRLGVVVTAPLAAQIKQMLRAGVQNREICARFGLSKYIVSKIKTGKAWADA